jgi:hypothetical protein
MSTFLSTMLPSILKPTRQDEIQITPSSGVNNMENSIIGLRTQIIGTQHSLCPHQPVSR